MAPYDDVDRQHDSAIRDFLHRQFCEPPSAEVMDHHLSVLQLEAARVRSKERRRPVRAMVLAGITSAAVLALLVVNQVQPTMTRTDDGPTVADVTPAADRPTGSSQSTDAESGHDVFDPLAPRPTGQPNSTTQTNSNSASNKDASGNSTGNGGASSTTSGTAETGTEQTEAGAIDPGSPTATTQQPGENETPTGPSSSLQASTSSLRSTTVTTRPTTTLRATTTRRTTTTRQTTTTRRATTTQRITTTTRAATSTTRPTTTRQTTTTQRPSTTISIPGPVGRPFQEKLFDAAYAMNVCMASDGFVFVGVLGESDHPIVSNISYLMSVARCDPISGFSSVIADHVTWELSLTAPQKDAVNSEGRVVFECVSGRGWDFGSIIMNERGLVWFSRFPTVTQAQYEDGSFKSDLTQCGFYDLRLG